MDYDVIVIGGGPGGYAAAIKCSQGNKKVLLVEERERLGGVCLNEGCVPTKALLQSIKALKTINNASGLGIEINGEIKPLPQSMASRSQTIVAQLTGGLNVLMDINKVEVIQGRAHLTGPGKINVKGKDFKAKDIIIATGTALKKLPVEGADLPHVIYSREALELKRVPHNMVIVGAGAIGIEFASIYKGLGSRITILEMLPRILPGFDQEMSNYLQDILVNENISFYLGSSLKKITKNKVLFIDQDGKERSLECDSVLIAVGRKVNLDLLDYGKEMLDEKGYIVTDEKMKTKLNNIWAIGDVNGKHAYAHVATAEALVAAANICGANTSINYSIIPHVVYTDPELAWTGLTEEELQKLSIAYDKAIFPLSSNAKALCENYSQGLIKILAGKKHKEILGVHILAPHAGELIGEALLGLKLEATAQEFAELIHAHPSVSEIFSEATLIFFGKGLHS